MIKRIILFSLFALLSTAAFGQEGTTTFTGTVLSFGSGLNTRAVTSPFTFRIKEETSKDETGRLIDILKNGGQTDLLDALRSKDVGSFSMGNRVAHDVSAIRVTDEGGKKRIRAVFPRWMNFGELRRGYRSVDYPFSYIDLYFDPSTGEGEGTFIAAAKIRFDSDDDQIEIEDFGTFPGKLMGVKMRGDRLP